MAVAVYALCALTSLACSILLLRGYGRTGTRLLLWSGLCFAGFFLNNLFLVFEARMLVEEMSAWGSLPALAGVGLLLFGLIWDARA